MEIGRTVITKPAPGGDWPYYYDEDGNKARTGTESHRAAELASTEAACVLDALAGILCAPSKVAQPDARTDQARLDWAECQVFLLERAVAELRQAISRDLARVHARLKA